jgi:hypothetical protein
MNFGCTMYDVLTYANMNDGSPVISRNTWLMQAR